MAQVKKFQKGGGLYLDGKQLTDEQINAAMDTLSAEDKYTWSKSIERARAGERVDLNELSNSVTGGDFSHVLNERQQRKNESGNLNRRQRNRHATWGTNIDSTNRGIANGIAALKSQLNASAKEDAVNTTALRIGSGWQEYDNNGNAVRGPQGMTNEEIIRDAFAYMAGDENYRKGFTTDKYGADLNGLLNWYKQGYDVNSLINRFNTNSGKDLSQEDLDVLKALGFSRESVTETPSELKMDESWNGNRDAADRNNVFFTKDKDGNWLIHGNEDYTKNTWYGGGLDFLAGTAFENGGIYNGRLFTREQIEQNHKDLDNSFATWMDARSASDWRDWYDRANTSGVRFSGDRISMGGSTDDYGIFSTRFNPNESYNENWSKYFESLGSKNPYDIADLSGGYSNLDGREVMAYVDPSNSYDSLGIRGVKYAVRNADGTYQTFDSEDALRSATGLTSANLPYGLSPREFKTSAIETIGGKKYSLAHELNTKGGQQNAILRGQDGNYYLAAKDPNGVHLKPRLIKNNELLQEILANPEQYDNKELEKLLKSGERKWSGYGNGYISSNKNGGKIKELPVFQYGGNLSKSKTTSKEVSSENVRTDVTSTHKWNRSDGGLTNAEKLQIAAAVGDLAGVGLSFAPGVGNVAGAAVGLGSTATRLVADIKKDGFQAKDAWSAAGGALLDLATVIPGLGTGAKTAKAVKTIKAAATPIMKVLSLAGAAQGVAAMGKVIRGEEITSEDLTAIISGLGSTVMAGKQLKDTIGDAKLAKKLATNVAESTNTAKNSELVGNTLKKTRQEIADLIGDTTSEKEVVNKVQNLLKQTNPDATSADARNVLKEWGVETSRSRFSGKEGWKEYLKFWKKGEKQVSFDVPKDKEAGSTLYYMLNPYARLKQTGFDWGIASSKGNLGTLDKSEIAAAERMLNNGSRSALAQSIARHTVNNPSAINVELEQIATRRRPGKWGWPVYMRGVKQTLPQQETKILALDAPQQMLMLPAPQQTPPQPSQILMLPAPKQNLPDPSYSRSILYRSLDEGWNPRVSTEGYPLWAQRWDDVYIDPTLPSNYYQINGLVDPIKFNSFQKGGKIQKAQPGSKVKVPSYVDVVEEDVYEPSLESEINKYFTGDAKTTALGHLNDATYSASISGEIEPSVTTANKPSVTTSNNPVGNPVGTRSQFGKNVLPALPAVTSIVGKATSGIRATNQQLQLAKDTYNSTLRNLEQNVPEHYQQYTEAGIDSDLSNVANKITSQANKAIYNDPTLNEAVRMQGAEKVSHLYAQGFDQKRKMFQNWLDKDNELRRNYALQRTAVENANRQRIAQADAYLNQQKGAAIAQKQGIYQGVMQDMGSLLSIPRQSVLSQEQMDAARDFNKWKAEKQGLYQSGINSGTIASGTSFDSWLSGNKDYLNQLYNHQDKMANIASKLKYLNFLKSGGKVSRHRPEAEQIRINQQKIVADAIKQLSKQSFEFLKMALS